MDLELQRPRLHRHRRSPRPRPGHGRRAWWPRAPASCSPGAATRRLDRAEDELGDARRGRRRRQRRPATPGRLIAAARDTWGRLDGALISVGGPPKGPVTGDHRRAVDRRLRVGLPRRRPARAARSARRCPHGGSLALVLSSSVRAPLADMAISNGLRPGLAMVAKTLADELGPARRPGQRAAARPGRHRAGRRARRRRAATPRRPREAAVRTIPLRPLRRAGGVRPGGRLPALAGGVVRHRRRCCRSTAACCARSEPLRSTPDGVAAVGARRAGALTAAPLVVREVAEAEDRQQRRRTTTAARRRSAARCRARAARPARAASPGAGSSDSQVDEAAVHLAVERRRRSARWRSPGSDWSVDRGAVAGGVDAHPAGDGHLAGRRSGHVDAASVPRLSVAIQPRSTSSAVPSAVTSGTTTSTPEAPSRVR